MSRRITRGRSSIPNTSSREARRTRGTTPPSFVEIHGAVFACGRDPYFPAWPDVLQLNAFDPGLRQAPYYPARTSPEQCDGVRCDMAMLLLNAVFERTWGGRAGPTPATDYWASSRSRRSSRRIPDFLFIAEAYWDLEWELQQQGFDFCYDKRLYDRLEHDDAENVRLHLCAERAYQEGWSASSRTMTSRGRQRRFMARRLEPRRLRRRRLPGARLLPRRAVRGTACPSAGLPVAAPRRSARCGIAAVLREPSRRLNRSSLPGGPLAFVRALWMAR